MKAFEYTGQETLFTKNDMENIFHAYIDPANDELYFNLCRSLNFKNLNKTAKQTYQLYTVQQNDTWNLISYKFYGTIRLWWIVCKFNGIINSVNEPEAGTNIRILNKEIVSDILRLIKKA